MRSRAARSFKEEGPRQPSHTPDLIQVWGCPTPNVFNTAKGSLQHGEAVQEKPTLIMLVRLRNRRFVLGVAYEGDPEAQNGGDR